MDEVKTRLTPQQLKDCDMAQRMLHDLLPDIDALEKCGVDCTSLRNENTRIRETLEKIKQYFGSGVSRLP